MWFTQKKDSVEVPVKTKVNNDEYIWVEGYKGTNSKMECTNKNVYFLYNSIDLYYQKYELNTPYHQDGEIKLCDNGFHFCKTLGDVFKYYSNFDSRYFKVRAKVKQSDWEQDLDKYVTSDIELIEEISLEEAWEFFKTKKLSISTLDNYELTFEDYKTIHATSCDSFYDAKKAEIQSTKKANLIAHDFSETFSQIILDKGMNYTLAIALADEGVSNDMRAYLLMNRKD